MSSSPLGRLKEGDDTQQGSFPTRSSSINFRAPRVSLTLGDFDIIRRIGDGSFSEVMQVRHKSTGVEYALKMVDKHLIVRHCMVGHIKQERNILDECDYPGIAKLFFTFQDEASLYLGQELCPNGELYDQIRCKGRLPVARARFYAAEMVLMLEYLRSLRIVHRDLKPENLLLDATGHLKLVDFGSAMRLTDSEEAPLQEDRQRKTSLVGTADYVAPEVLSNDEVTYAVDLWALGCIIFQMLTGRAPFKAASEYLTFQRIADCDYAFPPDCPLPEAAVELIQQLLKLEPSERFGASEEGLQQLKAHPFFEGIDWETLRDSQAPAFARPQRLQPDADELGLDWEMTSLAAALPVQYAAHDGAPLQRMRSGGSRSPVKKSRSSLSVSSAASEQCGKVDSMAETSAPVAAAATGVLHRAIANGGSIREVDCLHQQGTQLSASPSRRNVSVRRLSPFADDEIQAVEPLAASNAAGDTQNGH